MIRVVIADDHPIVRQGLRTFLDTVEDIEVVAEAADGDGAIAAVDEHRPDVVLMDLQMPGTDGIEATRRVADRTAVLALTSFATDDKVFGAIRAGARGYLLKETEPDELAAGIRKVAAGATLVSERVAARLMADAAGAERKAHRADLTRRELEVLRLVAQGLSNADIASELTVAIKTVKTHVSNILAKLGVSDRTQAAVYAVTEGLAEPDLGPGT